MSAFSTRHYYECSTCGKLVERATANLKKVTCFTCKRKRIYEKEIEYRKTHKYDSEASKKRALELEAKNTELETRLVELLNNGKTVREASSIIGIPYVKANTMIRRVEVRDDVILPRNLRGR